MAVAVVTDTTHYLPPELVEPRGLHPVSLYVRWDGGLEREADIADLDAFYTRLRAARDLPTTSQPSVGDFLAAYEPLLEAGDDIVSIHLSAGISGTYASALQARAALAERGLAERVAVVDSATGAGAMGMVALAAARAAADGADLAGVVARAGDARAGVRMWFCVDTLEYLRRGGRVGQAQAWLGGALKVKPILSVESEIVPVERVRTSARAFERMAEFLVTLRDEGRDGWVVQHIQAHEQAERLVERGRAVFGTEPLWVNEVGPVIGAHVGPGLIGVGGVPRGLLAA
jgi:DegV family protein with EDD domain